MRICMIPLTLFTTILLYSNAFALSKDISLSGDTSGMINNQAYVKAYKPMGISSSSDNEDINPATGNLELSKTDISLKGRNGLDLNITRRYNLIDASQKEPNIESTYHLYFNKARVKVDTEGYMSEVRFIEHHDDYGTDYDALYRYADAQFISKSPWDYDYSTLDQGYYSCTMWYTVRIDEYNWKYNVKDLTSNEKYSGLGLGWTFDFPYIEKRDANNIYLHMGNKGTFEVINSSTNMLKDYSSKDLILKRDSKESFKNDDGIASKYVLKEKDGKRWYFAEDGRLLGLVDMFDNKIKFMHNTTFTGSPIVSKIIDSVGRVVDISYTDDEVKVSVVDPIDSNNNRVVTYNKRETSFASGEYVLDNVIDVYGMKTGYAYEDKPMRVSLRARNFSNCVNNTLTCLTNIEYPTGAKTNYTYEKSEKNCGSSGITEFYKVKSRWDSSSTIPERNYYTYQYKFNNSGEYDGYPSYESDSKVPSTYQIKTKVSDKLGNSYIYTYNKKLLCVNKLSEGSAKKETIIDYDQNTRLPLIIRDRVYNNTTGKYIESVENYTYDDYKNVLGYWDCLNERGADFKPLNDEHKTSHTYELYSNEANDVMYSYITSKTYKRDENTTIKEKYVHAEDPRKVSEIEILEDGNMVKKTQFAQYDEYGNITKENNYIDYNQSITTYYSYDDNDMNRINKKKEMNGVYLTRKWIEDIRNSDGDLVDAKSGNNDGIVDEIYSYDWFGNMVEKYDCMGYKTSYQYDKLNRITKVTNPDDTFKLTVYTMNSDEYSVENIDEKSNRSKKLYDEFGNLIEEQVYIKGLTGYKGTKAYNYDVKSRLETEKDLVNGSTTEYIYDGFDRLLSKEIIDSEYDSLYKEIYTYIDADENGEYNRVTKVIEDGVYAPSITTNYYYDKMGKLAKQERVNLPQTYIDTFKYDYVGNKVEEKIGQSYFRYDYNIYGKVTKTYDINNDYITNNYDALGRIISVTDIMANKSRNPYSTVYTYDSLGRLLTESIPMEERSGTFYATVKKNDYDRNGNLIRTRVSTNKAGEAEEYNKTEYTYNDRNLLTVVTLFKKDTLGNYIPESYTQFCYDEVGNKERMATGLSDIIVASKEYYPGYKYEYNELNQLIEFTDPLGRKESYEYDANGNLISKMDRNGSDFEYKYDGLNRMISKSVCTQNGEGNAMYTYTYTKTGNISSITSGKETDGMVIEFNTQAEPKLKQEYNKVSYEYDSQGRLIKEIEMEGITKEYSYDENNNRKTFVIKQDGIVKHDMSYEYDNLNRLQYVYEKGEKIATYTYDENGNRHSLSYSNGNYIYYQYNLQNQIIYLENSGADTLSEYWYTYYLDGSQASKKSAIGDTVVITNYVYDDLRRLVSEEEQEFGKPTVTTKYSYDLSNNRKTMTVDNGLSMVETTYNYDANNRLISETKDSDITSYEYDNNGNQLQKLVNSSPVSSSQYDGFNQLIFTTVNDVTSTYGYGANGYRISKSIGDNTTKYIWDSEHIVLETDISGNIQSKSIRGIDLIACDLEDDERRFYLYNAHGDVVHLTDKTGASIKEYSYDAFGIQKRPMFGDVDGDVDFDSDDYSYTWQFLTGRIAEFPSKNGEIVSDVDSDGNIDSDDYAYMRQMLIGMINAYPGDKNKDGYVDEDEMDIKFRDTNPYRYCGEYFDMETKNVYLRARYYSPEIGRFITEDSVRGTDSEPLSLNLYTYCHNDPINYWDPSGNTDGKYYYEKYYREYNERKSNGTNIINNAKTITDSTKAATSAYINTKIKTGSKLSKAGNIFTDTVLPACINSKTGKVVDDVEKALDTGRNMRKLAPAATSKESKNILRNVKGAGNVFKILSDVSLVAMPVSEIPSGLEANKNAVPEDVPGAKILNVTAGIGDAFSFGWIRSVAKTPTIINLIPLVPDGVKEKMDSYGSWVDNNINAHSFVNKLLE